ncbi:PREDICTED: uncharacterized protein LOC109149189 [Ipomoea nil]|uniref:uncharacterized protein LOC109149189 n=1 Tax=Ipomoea nil TaxID=35883 RepID=UPI000900B995|nr:PREDICTED: uncharacterized protein LOC109149189 [Ipomoea nil]
MVGLLEPRISGNAADKACKSFGFVNWLRVEAVGFSGGIWLLWNNNLKVEIIATNPQFILTRIGEENRNIGLVSFVYGSPSQSYRNKLWEGLSNDRFSMRESWLSVGDYNAVTCMEDVSNTENFGNNRCAGMRQWIFKEGLIDLGFFGARYTWTRGKEKATFTGARLDRALCNLEWTTNHPETKVTHLTRVCSDHSPLLIELGSTTRTSGNLAFQFQAAWIRHPMFLKMIEGHWKSNMSIIENITATQNNCKEWNKSVFGNIENRKRKLMARIDGIQRCMGSQSSNGLIKLERKLRKELEEVLHQEELKWFQKSKEDWILSGDLNTKYYHAATMVRRTRNKVYGLKDDNDNWVSEKAKLEAMVQNYFKGLYRKENEESNHDDFTGMFPPIQEEQWLHMNRQVTKDEVRDALMEMAPLKASGPDGLHAMFYQKSWSIVGDSLYQLVNDFFNIGSLPNGLNETNIVLIPKVQRPEKVNQLRPISLCNVAYKLVTKIMAQRLKLIMPEVVSPNQGSFVSERQITDNIITYQEILHTIRTEKNQPGYMVLKIDLEKAYDRLDWSFIRNTLQEVGLNDVWVRNIMHCVESAEMSILWEGNKLERFKPERGVRQGDSISPYLFVLCIERLGHIITEAVTQGSWKGIKVSRNGPSISHLFFADDMVLFAEANESQICTIMNCLDRFCKSSGQKVNKIKSNIFFSKNVCREDVHKIATIAGIPATDDLGRYLGVPSLHGRITKEHYRSILDRVQSKLEGWKTRFLSLAGRQVLTQSVLNAIPSYAMQTMFLPKGVCDAIDKTTRNFLWGGDGTKRKTSLVNWDTVTLPKEEGGLGIKSMRNMNLALLAKLGWRILKDGTNTWSQILSCKYMKAERSMDRMKRKRNDSNIWKGICAAVPILERGMMKVVMNGKNTSFWEDRWIGDESLQSFLIGPMQRDAGNIKVAEIWDGRGRWDWDAIDIGLHPDKRAELAARVIINDEQRVDSMGWSPNEDKSFSTRSAYKLTRQTTGNQENGEWEATWKLRVPNRIRTFIWLVQHGRIMCNSERRKRGFTADERCAICGAEKEDVEHTMRSCPAAEEVWKLINNGDNQGMSLNSDFNTWLKTNVTGNQGGQRRRQRCARFAITAWWIWKWRNDRVFNGVEKDINEKIAWLHRQFKEVEDVLSRNAEQGGRQREDTRRKQPWRPPNEGWIKVNTDGCARTKGHSACGGVLRNNEGQYIGGFSKKIGTCSALEAEVWGIYVGIQKAWELGYRKVMFETDCSKAINLINGAEDYDGTAKNLVQLCRDAKTRNWEISFTYAPREQNKVADMLANQAYTQGDVFNWFVSPPRDIQRFLREDELGLFGETFIVRVA